MNLLVALRAVRVERLLQAGTRANVSQERGIVEVRPFAVPGVATQAKESHRLAEQVVGHRAVRIVADCAILGHRRVLVRERALFVSMALIADHVDRRLLEIVFGLAVWVMAGRARHLAFLDRMVRRHCIHCINVRVALVAHEWFVDCHWSAIRPADICMLNVNHSLNVEIGMWIVAVHTSHPVPGVGRRMPCHGR